jgi:type IV secretion system protein VirB10
MTQNVLMNFPVGVADPRQNMNDNDLAESSHNSFPIVASNAVRKDRAGLIAGGAVALVLGALTFFSLGSSSDRLRTEQIPKVAAPAPPPKTHAPVDPATPATTVLPSTPAQQAVLAKPPALPDVQLRMGNAPVMVFDASLPDGAGLARATPTANGPAATPASTGLGENEAFGARVGSAGVDAASATRIVDPTNMVTQGTMIPAILETAIDSDLPGFVRAVVSQDVKSFDGARILVPRSSRLIGQYKSGLAAGQTRVYVMWTRLIRPDGVTVALASPGIEFSGRSGLSGEVDGHFFKRFGAASLLSVLGGLGAIASGGTAGLLIVAGGSSAAASAAQRDGQIPPTVRISPGQPIRVFTARDLDFSTVNQ